MTARAMRIAEARRWASYLPGLGLYRDRFLVKRVGPVVSGLCLEVCRDSRLYQPIAFAHNLLGRLDELTLGYGRRLGLCRYGATNVGEECRRHADLLTGFSAGSFGEFLNMVKASFAEYPPFAPDLIWDVFTLAVASSSISRNGRFVDWIADHASKVHANWLPVGGFETWLSGLRDALSRAVDPDLEAVTRRLGLEGLPSAPLAATPVDVGDLEWVFLVG